MSAISTKVRALARSAHRWPAGRSLASLAGLALLAFNVHAAEVKVAVAANFTAPMQRIAQLFEAETGHKAVLSFGATGALYAQVKNGAPFQVFLSADAKTPEKMENEGLAVAGSRFTYAVGKLALWSRDPALVDGQGEVLRTGGFERIALANPKLAPYGAAAVETMTRLGVLEALRPKFVQGDNIAQTYQFAATGNAQLGFVALSQVTADGKIKEGSAWLVPAGLYSPIRQDAALLANAKDDPAAQALMAFLRSEPAHAVIRAFGYDL